MYSAHVHGQYAAQEGIQVDCSYSVSSLHSEVISACVEWMDARWRVVDLTCGLFADTRRYENFNIHPRMWVLLEYTDDKLSGSRGNPPEILRGYTRLARFIARVDRRSDFADSSVSMRSRW